MSEQLPFRIKRSAVEGKRPQNADLELGELALNTYDGRLFAKKDTGGVGVGTTVTLLTPWTETVGVGIYYTEGNVGLGTTNPTSKLFVSGDINFTGNLYQNGGLFISGGSSQWTTYAAGISTTSNVGIGTTNPTTKLQVNGSVTLGAGSTDLITIPGRIASNFYPDGDGTYDIGRPTQIGSGANRWRDANFSGKGSFDSGVDAHDIEIGVSSANLIYSTFGNLELNSQSGTTNIDDNVTISGNTGIGTATPISKLHVVGDGRFIGVVTATTFNGNLTGTATTATNLENAANIATGTISSSRLSGTYGIDITGTATTATNLENAANITTGTISSSRLSGTYGIDITGTATTATNLSDAANIITGTISSSRLSGSYGIDIIGTATTATNLSDAANITTGTISSSRLSGTYGISITGTATTANNLSDAANITTGTISSSRLSGTYGISITGTATTANNLSDAANITTGTIDKDRISNTNSLTVLGDLYVSNNISFGGSTTQLNTQQLQIVDSDIVLGIGTSFSPTDNTANHGGIAIASTEGTPLVNLNIVPEETNPSTYKKIMWFKGDTIGAGLTDAWLFNYGVGIGSTQVPYGVRLAVGQIQMADSSITATTFNGNLNGTATTATNLSDAANITTGTISSSRLSGSYGIDIIGTATTATNLENAANITTGTISSSRLSGTYGISITGTATTATNLSDAANITTGTISSSRLSGTYGISITGTATTANNLSDAANITTGTISSSRLSGSYGISITGTATTATNLSNAANITTGTISSSRLSGSYGIDITGTATTATNLSDAANITTGTISSSRLSGSYGIDITGTATTATTANNVSSTININTSGIITASSFTGNLTGTATTATNLEDAANITTGTISSSRLSGSYGISITGTATTATNLSDAANITTGTISSSRLSGTYGISITGTATTATNLSDAANITTGTISSSRLSGTYGISITGTATTATNLSDAANITTGTISSSRLSGSYGIDIIGTATTATTATTALGFSTTASINTSGIITASSFTGNLTGTATTATNLSDAANITTGTISSSRLSGSYGIDITGTATTATNLSDAANITTGTISSSRLTGTYGISITGTATTATNLSDAANITTGTISSSRLSGSYGISITGTATTATTSLGFSTTASINTSGIITATRFSGDGSTLTGINASQWTTYPAGISTTSNVGIGTTNPESKLTVNGAVQIQQDSSSSSRLVFRAKPGNAYRWNIDNDSTNIFRIFREDDETAANGVVAVSISTTGTISATKFSGDGSLLTGITASGSGVAIQNQGSNVGTASTINFSTNLTASFSSGTATISLSNNPSISGILTADQVYTSNNGNGQNVRIGDDFWLGDVNVADTTRFSGAQDSTRAFVIFGSSDAVSLGRTGTGPLYYGGNFTSAGIITATRFSGDGSTLTGINASQWTTYPAGISTTSNVGIGTTNPTQKLTVSNNILLGSLVSGQTATPSYLDLGTSYSDGTTKNKCKLYLYNTGSAHFGFSVGSDTDLQYHSENNGTHDFYINNGKIVSINSFGVGIGVTTPTSTQRLCVLGSSNTFIEVNTSGVLSPTGITFLESNSTKWVIANRPVDNNNLYFSASPADRNNGSTIASNSKLTISQSGNLGIGTTNPTSKLQVVGNGLFSGTGIVTATTFVGSLTGTATTATNLSNAANITTGTISSSRLTGTYGISITGTATTATNLSNAANITTGTISSSRLSGSYGIDITGTATTATTANNVSSTISINTSGIITATQLDLSANASTDDSVLYLSGIPLGTSTKNGLLGIGQLSFSDTDIVANFTHNVNGYAQVVLQNKNSGASASSDFVVNNDRTAGTTYYGDFGINGTTFSGGGPFGDPDGTYLYAAGGTLTLGSLDAYALKLATNNTERLRIDGTNVGIGTTVPTSTLHVQGDARITGIVTATSFVGDGSQLTGITGGSIDLLEVMLFA